MRFAHSGADRTLEAPFIPTAEQLLDLLHSLQLLIQTGLMTIGRPYQTPAWCLGSKNELMRWRSG